MRRRGEGVVQAAKTALAEGARLIVDDAKSRVPVKTGKLREQFNIITDKFSKIHSDVLPEYCRYLGTLTLVDSILNICLGVDEETADNDALNNARAIFKLTPTTADIDDTTRETDSIKGFIAENQSRFIEC